MPGSVLVALSGGVDSAVAACLLKDAGHEVFAITMRLWALAETGPARRICKHLGIRHSVVDLTAAFEQGVVKYFLEEYSRGRTPNPCVRCNPLVKFAALRSHAADLGCGKVATGHYARVEKGSAGRFLLKRGVDPAKDQSYFLWALSQEQLAAAEFPLGAMTKDEARSIAADAGISGLVARESQDICFLKREESCQSFIRERIGDKLTPGPVRDTCGNALGTHEGIELYTTGQRRGLGIAGGKPLYVVDIIPEENAVVLGSREDAKAARLRATSPNWIAWEEPPREFDATVKIRHVHPGAKAHVKAGYDGILVEFEEPQFAVTPGQSAVFCDGDTVLGGAIIEKRL